MNSNPLLSSKYWQYCRQVLKKYRRSLSVISGLLLVYTLLGFVVVPWAVQRYLTQTLASGLQHPVEVKRVAFNPFKVKFEVDGFAIIDNDKTPLLSFDVFSVDYSFLSLFRWRYGIEDISLVNPYVKLDADGKGSYTLLNAFSHLADGASAKAPEKKEDKASDSLPSIWLGRLAITGGNVDYRDANRAGGFSQKITLPSIAINDFYTKSNIKNNSHANAFSLEVGDTHGGVIKLEAALSALAPLQVSGSLSINQLSLAPAWQWLMLPVNFNLKAPILEFKTDFALQMIDALDFQALRASLSLKDTSIYSKDNSEIPAIQLPLLAVNDVNVNLLQQSVVVNEFKAESGIIHLIMDKQGVANLQTLFQSPQKENEATPSPAAPSSADSSAANSKNTTKPWDVLIHHIKVENYTINIRDEQPADAFVFNFTPLNINIDEWRPLAPDKFSVQLHSGITTDKEVGQLTVDTQLQLSPLVADTKLQLTQFLLPTIQPYVQGAVHAAIKDGQLGADLNIHYEAADKPVLNVDGKASVKQLSVTEQKSDKSLLHWDDLDVAGVSYRLQENALKIDKISLVKPETGFTIHPDGSTNIQKMLIEQPPAAKKMASTQPASAKKSTSSSAPPMKLAIAVIDIQKANLAFADASMKPNFRVAMSELSGSIDGLSSDAKSQAKVNLKGKVDRYAPVTINGKLNPLAEKPSLDMHLAFSNLELTTFTPYSGTYAGFNIKQGQLSLDIDYQLVDNKIQGKNKIVMNQLQLGEHVQSDKAVDLPLRLAIALLRDQNGVIDLGFEVGGDLNDPQFSVGGILWKVLSNMVMKVVTSPFKALASLTGGGETEGIDKIDFAAGQFQLDQVAMDKLKTAAALLNKRAGLKITVQGNVLPEVDRAALQDAKLIAVLRQDKEATSDIYLSAAAAVDDGGAYRAFNRYYKKQSNKDLGDLVDGIKSTAKAKGEAIESDTAKRMAYEQAWKTARDKIGLKDEELRQLALERAKQIKAALVEQNGVAPERVFVLDANTNPEKASLSSALSLDVD